MQSEWVGEEQLPQVRIRRVRKSVADSLHVCIKIFHSLGQVYYEQHHKPFTENNKVLIPALSSLKNTLHFKSNFSLLSNNHIYACKI